MNTRNTTSNPLNVEAFFTVNGLARCDGEIYAREKKTRIRDDAFAAAQHLLSYNLEIYPHLKLDYITVETPDVKFKFYADAFRKEEQ